MLVDSHCHLTLLDFTHYPKGIDTLFENATNTGVRYFLNVATAPENWQPVLDIAIQHHNVFASVGVHPSDKCENEPSEEILIAHAQHAKIIAIGETGLDYFHINITKELQQERFRRQIRVARQLKKPLIVHTRDAAEDTIAILKEERADEVGGVFHCFTENWDVAKAAMDLNFKISFSGIVTFKNAEQIKQVAIRTPDDFILVETDTPFLTPVPFRGKINEPSYVYYIARYISEIRSQSFEHVAEMTTRNFFQLFKDANYALHQT